jgi:hypothetical protein
MLAKFKRIVSSLKAKSLSPDDESSVGNRDKNFGKND